MADNHPNQPETLVETLVRRASLPEGVSRPLVTPLQPSVVYASPSPDVLDAQYSGEVPGYTYAREGHPNADLLALKIDMLEQARGGLITGSGMAAITAVLMSLLKSGDHVIGGNQLYGRSLRLMTRELPRYGIGADLIDPTDAAAIAAAIRPETKLILVEVISNPTLRIADMKAIVALAQGRGILLAVDNTFATPLAYRPLQAGADIVIHSVTKLLAGHSDVTLGYATARQAEHRTAIREFAVTTGLTPSPYECWLAERGLYTFPLRRDRAEANARQLADMLADHPSVARVIYPGRADHPDRARARTLLQGRDGNMLSFEIRGGRAAANQLVKSAPQLVFAPTLGDVGTVVAHPASSSHRALTPEARTALGITEGFFRVSVGIEEVDLLISDFKEALRAV
ncbi:MAG: aminotransferase class I/II-fold pyridoxal phosphate-dependent enzyme [Rhodobacteraceae bacterium]|nr:aminotransferase class I/II-fold pyridoxal phosphate-dependent enzyme [Paracoccaceae bacterium]